MFCKLNKIDFVNYIATRFFESYRVHTCPSRGYVFWSNRALLLDNFQLRLWLASFLSLFHDLSRNLFELHDVSPKRCQQKEFGARDLGLIQMTILLRLVWSVSPCLVKPTPSNASLNSSPRASRKMPRSPRLAHKAPDMQAKFLFAWTCNWFNYLPQGKH